MVAVFQIGDLFQHGVSKDFELVVIGIDSVHQGFAKMRVQAAHLKHVLIGDLAKRAVVLRRHSGCPHRVVDHADFAKVITLVEAPYFNVIRFSCL